VMIVWMILKSFLRTTCSLLQYQLVDIFRKVNKFVLTSIDPLSV
jgi:hypothetical protein